MSSHRNFPVHRPIMLPPVLSLAAVQAPGSRAAAPVPDSLSTLAPLGEVGGAINEFMRRILYLPEQQSTVAARVDQIHYFEFVSMGILAVVVATIGIYFAFRYRRRRPGAATPHIEAPFAVEIGGAAMLLLLFLFCWLVAFRQFVYATDVPEHALDVYVTGQQWVWKFAYPRGRSSAGVLFVPAGQPIHLIITSRDVIHSFFVPEFRLKKDAVPGRYTSLWFEAREPGAYRIFCAEMCGIGHSRMWGQVIALDAADFERWQEGWNPEESELEALGIRFVDGFADAAIALESQHADLAAQGMRVAAEKGCLGCHSIDGRPHIGPTWRGLFGSRVALQDGTEVAADEAYITRSMMDPEAQIVAGFQPVMPSFLGQIGAAETAAIVEFIKSLQPPVDLDSIAPLLPNSFPADTLTADTLTPEQGVR